MSSLRLIVLLLFLSFHVVDKIIDIVWDLVRPWVENLRQCLLNRVRKLDHPADGQRVLFACKSRDAEHAKEVYIAGSFNDWLQARGPKIRPYSWQSKAYRMRSVIEDGKAGWQKVLWLSPGTYDFKFVVGKNQWIAWWRASGYPRGNDAPGGPNLRVEVDP